MDSNPKKYWTLLLLIILNVLLVSPILANLEPLDSAKNILIENPEGALEILLDLEASPASKESPQFLGEIFFQKGKAYNRIGNYEKTIEQLDKAAETFRNSSDYKKAIEATLYAGDICLRIGKQNEALALIESAMKEADLHNDTILIVKSKISSSHYYYQYADYHKALKELYEIEKITEISKKEFPGKILLNIQNDLGNVHTVSDNKAQAKIHYKKAIEICKEFKLYGYLSALYFNLGNLYFYQDSIKNAEHHYFKSLEAAEQYKIPSKLGFSNMIIGDFLLATNQSEKKAHTYLMKGLPFLIEAKDNGNICFTYGLLGIAQLRQGNKSNAVVQFQNMENLLTKHSNYANNSEILGRVSKSCYENGLFDLAYYYQNINQEIEKKIYNEKSQKELLQLRTNYETNKKEIQIDALKKENFNQSLIGSLLLLLIAALGFFTYILWRQHYRLREKNNELNKAKLMAEQLAKAKTDFLATMSHEIRTPMNGVIGMVNILNDENTRPDQKENLDILKFSADNLLNLINDILDLAKMDSGKIELEKQSFDLKNHFQKLFSIFKTANKKSAVQMNLDIQLDGLENQVLGDTMRLNQVVTNLINNALKFTKEGFVSLKITTVSQTENKAKIKFEIIDTGIGISEENQKSIFEKYQQAENETSRLYGGTGLGLNIAKEIIELHGGKLNLQSETGKGSNFYFEIDFPISKTQIQAPTQSKIALKKSELDGMKILLAEDNRVNQMVAKRLLNKWKVDLTIAEDGAEAVDLFKANDFDLILMDIQMPKMNGFEATEIIRKLPNGKLPIFSMSASTFSTNYDIEHKNLMDGHIGKPFNPDELFTILSNHFTKKNIVAQNLSSN